MLILLYTDQNLVNNETTVFNLNELRWGDENNSSAAIILAIHGYNDYSRSFEIPANFFQNSNLLTIAIDLQGFGKNSKFWPMVSTRKSY